MSTTKKYLVKRRHDGDRLYEEGDIREAREVDVKHLVPNVLEPVEVAGVKAEPAPRNKAEPAAPANKASKSAKD